MYLYTLYVCAYILEVTSCKKYIFLFVRCHAMPAHEGCFTCKTAHSHRIHMQTLLYIIIYSARYTCSVLYNILYSKNCYTYIYMQTEESVAMDNYCNCGRQKWAFFILLAICIVVLLSATVLGEWSEWLASSGIILGATPLYYGHLGTLLLSNSLHLTTYTSSCVFITIIWL